MPSHGREFPSLINRPQFRQDGVAVGNRARRRRFHERKIPHLAQLEGFHPQNDGRQITAQNFRVGKSRTPSPVIFIVKPNADAVRDTAAAAGALVGGGLTHGLHQELLHLIAVGVTLDAGQPRIHHKTDAGNRQRRFRDVRRQHHAPQAARSEDAFLIGRGQAGE